MPVGRTVCMVGHPAAGHINPTLPVIAELVRSGERVLYWATEPFRERVESTGAEFRSLGQQEWFERGLASGGMLGGMAGLYETTREILEPLAAQVRAERPDYLLVEAHAVWGNLLQQMLELPAVTLCSMFAINEKLISPLSLVGHLYGGTTARGAFEGMIGLSRYLEIARAIDSRYRTRSPGILGYLGNPQRRNVVFTSREFQVGGEAFDDSYRFVGPTAAAPFHAASRAPFGGLPPGDAPLVYISMGTMYNNEPGLYRACFSAFVGNQWRAVMSVGRRMDLSALPEVPPNFAVHAEVPQLEVLRQSALFVTHGGINSAHEAMLAGVPMIVLPCAADHFVVASQVEATGAGVVLDRREATVERLSQLAAQVLSEPRYCTRSSQMGDSLRAAGGAQRAAAEILAYIH